MFLSLYITLPLVGGSEEIQGALVKKTFYYKIKICGGFETSNIE
jgi:hypothetical protein